jgi:endonuclease I
MIDLFENRDTFATFNGYTCERVITCQYSGLNQPYRYPLVWNTYDFSREHTYAHTWMPSYPADNPEKPEYNDQHHLFPTNQTKANAPRCNYPMGEVVSPSYTFLNCKLGLNQNNQKVFEPRNEHKGRVARAIMYMSVAYNTTTTNWGYPNRPPDGTTCSGTPINYKQDEYILKKWNYLYPPTGYEIARNDFLDSIQGNRNPFIDHPEWACYINFTTMTQQTPTDTLCAKMIGYNEISLDLKTHLFPNPATNQITFAILDAFINASLEIYDINGKKIKSKQYEQTTIIEEFINTEHWPKGLYLLHFSSEKGSVIKKFIVE